MSKQTINIGASPNDGTGTPLRTSFDYTNQNFTELYTALGGGVGLPGATTQVIFNDGGTNLAGDAGLVYNKTTDALTIGGNVQAASATITGDLTARNWYVTGGSLPGVGNGNPFAYRIGGGGLGIGAATETGTTAPIVFYAGQGGIEQYRIAPLGVNTWSDGAGGTRMTLNSTGLGVGAAPELKLRVDGPDAAPATSGSSTTNGAFRIGAAGASTNLCVDAGVFTTGGVYGWFQARSRGNYALNYDLVFNPNGGNVGIGVTPSAGKGCLQLSSGINFPATQVASSDANTLDDYEEGTFTPTVIGSTLAGVGTYTQQKGFYTKVGRLVTVNVWLQWTAHTGTGNMSFSGLPFTIQNTSGNYGGISIGYVSNIALTAGNVIYGLTEFGTTNVTVAQSPTGGGTYSLVPMDISAEIAFTATYIV